MSPSRPRLPHLPMVPVLVAALLIAAVAAPAAALATRHPLTGSTSPAAVGDTSWRDYDGDGFADLAVGIPLENVSGQADAGAVQVLYGSSDGLQAAGSQFWHQGIAGVQDDPGAGDRFGSALASGDFDGDGFADLAIGVPGEDVGASEDEGVVQILYGSSVGLTNEDRLLDVSNVFDAGRYGIGLAALDAVDTSGSGQPAGSDGQADLVTLALRRSDSKVQVLILAGPFDSAGGASGFTLSSLSSSAGDHDDLTVVRSS